MKFPRPISILILALTAPTNAQLPAPAEPLIPVDQGIADIGALNASLQVPRADLRVASDFERVYRAPGKPDMLMRVDGALYALFAESEYVRTEAGRTPVVPAGTVWSIGEPSIGCTDPAKPVCNQLPAQQPFFSPPPNMPEGPACPPPVNGVSLIAVPRAQPVGRPLHQPRDGRVTTALAPTNAIELEASSPNAEIAPRRSMPEALDLCDPFYRGARLREIALRHGPDAAK